MQLDVDRLIQRHRVSKREYENGLTIEVYCAKNAKDIFWQGEEIKNLVLQSRKSYFRYGNVPVEDAYDRKSHVLVARASYPQKIGFMQEWLSARFIPASGEPYLFEDFLNFNTENSDIYSLFCANFFRSVDACLDQVYSISRVASISPARHFLTYGENNGGGLNWSSLLFASLIEYFLSISCSASYLTAILNKKRKNQLFSHGQFLFHSPQSFRDQINGGDKKIIRVDRERVAYKYPSYYLNVEQLLQLCLFLYDRGFFTQETFLKYQITRIVESDITELTRVQKLLLANSISRMLLSEQIIGSSILPKDFKYMINESVDDAVDLYCVPCEGLEKSIDSFLINFVKENE